MKRRIGVGVGLVVVVLAIVLWRSRGTSTSEHSAAKPVANERGSSAHTVGVVARPTPDPRTLPKGSISGTIRDPQKRPIANATVCLSLYSNELPPDFWEKPECKTADANGAYAWKDLFVAEYSVTASARGFRFASYHPSNKRNQTSFKLRAGESKTGIDLTLFPGGVEITGVVNDISGGPIARAHVRASMGSWGERGSSPPVETDDKGAFAMWVPEGSLRVTASADGYATGSQLGRAPGTFEVLLTPESSLAGIVIDARTEQPIVGADVSVERTQWEGMEEFTNRRTDEKGAFRIDGLSPGRYTATVQGKHGYGRSEGSTLVGLGEHVTGVVVRVFPTTRVIGKVVVASSKEVCTESGVNLRDEEHDRWASGTADDDGTVTVEGVLPGTYKVNVWCRGNMPKDEYPDVVVVDKDLTGLVWEVDTSGVVAGTITTKSGTPVADANIWARSSGGAAREKEGWNSGTSDADGTYELRGLKTATYKLELSTDAGVTDKDGYKVDAKAGETITKDIVLDDGGTLTGTVVDAQGKAVPNVSINAAPLTENTFRMWGGAPNKSDANGAFTITALRAGDYRVTASRGWWDSLRKPGTNDDARQGEKTTITAGKTSTVRLVVESQSGTIKGIVLDATGVPVSDAFLSHARESDAAGAGQSSAQSTRGYGWGDDKPVLTATDGTFTIGDLAPGKYTIRAFRKGGGEAFAEHVAVGTTNAKLQIKPTGSLEGNVQLAGGPPPDEMTISIQDLKTGYSRTETFFRTKGHFIVNDLPAGHFHVNANAAAGQAKTELDLADGEHKAGLALTLQALVTLTGRVVDFVTKAPVPKIRMYAQLVQGGSLSFSFSEETDNISDESGRFTVKRVPRGRLAITGMPKDWKESDYAYSQTIRDVSKETSSTVDIGDVSVAKKRVKDGQTAGEMGLHFKELPPDTEPDKYEWRVSFIEPDGPAAKTDIKVGDVIVSVDGVDITGENGALGWNLMNATPGTKLTLGLARGATIVLTLAAPS